MRLVALARWKGECAGIGIGSYRGGDNGSAGAVKGVNVGGMNRYRRRETEFVVDVVIPGDEMDVAEKLACASHDFLCLGYVGGCVGFAVNDVTEADTCIRSRDLQYV